ncbi:hypothetical protein [Humisphaera borealis]|uniref:DUF2946 domain-containing protein n=1 Tax=Humisphaera borealis TaxID=2807512 RepID=A0A7M2WSA3_9BACT|nr:hypothetical protein [Humisphaera borealis]QOV88388.1 hypothetical protein IPV69_19345 [Humisphaera borealis]
MRFTAVILLLLGVVAAGTGAVAHLHRAQHATNAHHHHDDHRHVEHDDDGDHDNACHELTADVGDHDGHCQTCLDLLFRVVIADAAPPTVACRAAAVGRLSLEWQVFVVAIPLCIDSTGPPVS